LKEFKLNVAILNTTIDSIVNINKTKYKRQSEDIYEEPEKFKGSIHIQDQTNTINSFESIDNIFLDSLMDLDLRT